MGHGGPLLKVQHPADPLTQYFVSSGKVKSMSQINYCNFLQVSSLKCNFNRIKDKKKDTRHPVID
jgi:hypothetical protein